MRILIYVLVLIGIVSICSAQNSHNRPDSLDLEGVITIHIKSASRSENVLVTLNSYHSFPRNDVSVVQDTINAGDNELYLRGHCRNLGLSFLHVADSTYTVLGAPGDTINVAILTEDSYAGGKRLLSFEGKNKEVQEYYRSKARALNDPFQDCMNLGISSADLRPFQKKMDESYSSQFQFWQEFQKAYQLPDWFITYETNALNYTDAWLRVYMVWYQTSYQKKKQAIPDSYYAFKSRIKVKNEAVMYHYDYLRFLREQLFSQMRESTSALTDLAGYARQILGENLGSFFEIWELSGAADNPNWVDTKFSKQFPANHQYLVDYIQQRAKKNIQLLKSGDKAPNFALVDLNDSLVTLNQYKGQVVYLSFWFTTCGPCIKEIPYENKLVEQFKGQPVKVISICTGTPGVADGQQIAKWRAASKKFGLKTINLFANRSWTNTLTKNYIVSVYPHYVLIGADGNIIENFTNRPDEGAASKIKKALSEIKR